MANVNAWVVGGYVGKKPEIKSLHDGKTVCNFSIGHQDTKKETQWIKAQVWGQLGERCAEWLDAGAKVTLTGRHQSRQYQKKDGTTGFSTEIVVYDVEFPTRKEAEAHRGSGFQPQAKEPTKSPTLDEIPF